MKKKVIIIDVTLQDKDTINRIMDVIKNIDLLDCSLMEED